jgi:hypothetical protein
VVIKWVLDDGVQKRVHRTNLMFKEHKFCGISCGSHKTTEHCVVAVFAGQVVSKDQVS